LIKTFPVIHNS